MRQEVTKKINKSEKVYLLSTHSEPGSLEKFKRQAMKTQKNRNENKNNSREEGGV